ncbi:hypothetical protein WJX72_012491 [[Myrmecia] bisecta]|uniref:Uncharacterized protein n=1 Tax=[Myrmecia] bisecta TaxID=41462 RepID=A0AAW1RB71_9CHLO
MHKSSPPWKLPDVAEERAGEDGDGRTGASRSPAAQDLKLRFTDENCPPSPALSCMEQDDQPAARPVPWQLSCDVTPNDAGPLPAGHLDCDEAAASLQLRSAEPDSTVLNSTSDGQGDTSGPAIGPPSPLTGPAISKSVLDRALWQAEQDGDAEAVQRIWAKMQAGASRADVDSLNLLLKSFCRVGGNPGEAEALVKEACQGGKIMPNAATYHQLAGMWLRHEQLHCE